MSLLKTDISGFIVSLIATSIGVYFGFRLDRIAERKRKAQEDLGKNKKLSEAFKYIEKSLSYNKENLDSLKATLHRDKDNLKIILPLDISTWEQFRNIVNEVSSNIELQYLLSHFYMVAEYIVKLQSNYLQYAIYKTSIFNKEKKRKKEVLEAMHKNLVDFTEELLNCIVELNIKIGIEQAKLNSLFKENKNSS
jgi:hypothetical protein